MQNHSTDKLAIILINYNNYKDTIDCIESIYKVSYNSKKIILVDNGSGNESSVYLQKSISEKGYELDFLQLENNLGFAGGNNYAIQYAVNKGYRLFWLLNNDTEIDPDSIKPMVELITSDPQCGAVGSKIYYWNTDIIWSAGGFINKWTGQSSVRGKNNTDSNEYNSVINCDYLTGCSLLIRYEALQSVGLMKDDYFLYYEETDWCVRAARKGWKMLYCPSSIVYHKVGRSTGGYSDPFIAYYNLRNRYTFVKRNYGLLNRISAFLYLLFRAFKIFINIYRKRRDLKKARVKAVLLALYHSYTGKMGKYTG